MKTESKIAVIGMSCRFPEADSPQQLWENILHGRRSFRRIPEKRLGSGYFSGDPGLPESITSVYAALLKNYSFDRNRFGISRSSFLTADLAHWLALEVAADTLQQAVPDKLLHEVKDMTGVVVGNTLTGEQTRANLLRLRWPYVAACLSASFQQQGRDLSALPGLLQIMEENFKKPFAAMEEDSLAGGLSNTIAGRICNYFDLKGGGYTIDGACSSSLLAIAKLCDAIRNKELVLGLAGGVDISLDPFELVGFSRAGALAKKEMLVYDKDSNGFWPGEGCGFVALADYDFACENKVKILAVIRGWGISSDGKGGLTRPEVDGQYLALSRTYEKAGYGIETVSYLEGHGTGTRTGDQTELSAILQLLPETKMAAPVYIGSVKANIGHTKAAAGIAGFIKAVSVLQYQLIPAVTANRYPHPLFSEQENLRLPKTPITCQPGRPLRAGVSSMGFGGINTHITLEEYPLPGKLRDVTNLPGFSRQDTELFLFAEKDINDLKEKLALLAERAGQLSQSEMTDLSCTLFRDRKDLPCRAAFEASTPGEILEKIVTLQDVMEKKDMMLDTDAGVFYSEYPRPLRTGLLFPGQGNQALAPDGILVKRFPFLNSILHPYLLKNFSSEELLHTDISQPAITATSLAAVALLEKAGLHACAAIGHSVGELAAMAWASILSPGDALQLAMYRGTLMHNSGAVKGRMMSVYLNESMSLPSSLTDIPGLSVACYNSPRNLVLSGRKEVIDLAVHLCKEQGLHFTHLPVENAFHSSLMEAIKDGLASGLSGIRFNVPEKNIYSTVTGCLITGRESFEDLLLQQLTQPVLFYQAFSAAAANADLWVEAGAGSTLTNLVKSFSSARVCTVDLSGNTVAGLARIMGTLYVCGNPVNCQLLFEDRFYRPFRIEDPCTFIESPCEQFQTPVPIPDTMPAVKMAAVNSEGKLEEIKDIDVLLKKTLSEKLGLPLSSFSNDRRMLNDFHLNSLFVGQFLAEFAAMHGLAVTDAPLEYANASLGDIISMFRLLNSGTGEEKGSGRVPAGNSEPEGIEDWTAVFQMTETQEELSNNDARILFEELPACITLGEIPDHLVIPTDPSATTEVSNLLVFLYGAGEDQATRILLQCARILKENTKIRKLLFLQDKHVSGGFAKSLFLESDGIEMSVISSAKDFISPAILAAELNAANGFSEISYHSGKRFSSSMGRAAIPGSSILPGKDDVILVTGGAKGITLECVRALGEKTGCFFILTGRSPRQDKVMERNLASLRASHTRFEYFPANIADPESAAALFLWISQQPYTVTGILHAAGINKPGRASELTPRAISDTLDPKLKGLHNLLTLTVMDKVNFCICFGSLIAHTGMAGNADYALANEWMDEAVRGYAAVHPQIKFLTIHWTVWGGTGMGHQLGVLESLRFQGIRPITTDQGTRTFLNILAHPPTGSSVIVTGRFGSLRTLKVIPPEGNTPLRFLEQIILYYPGTEVIAVSKLSVHTDLYLADHRMDGKMIWPAVFGLEAMVQAVSLLTGSSPAFLEIRDAAFLQAIVVGDEEEKRIQVIAQRTGANQFMAVVRDESTGFRKDHFRAIIQVKDEVPAKQILRDVNSGSVPIDTETDIYEGLLFHTGVFRQINSYSHIHPYGCTASAGGRSPAPLFSAFLPRQLLLGNPVLNDAALHAVQVCVPDKVLLPVGFQRISFFQSALPAEIIITASETDHNGNEYTYDITVTDHSGQVYQQWESARFRAIQQSSPAVLPLYLAQIALQRKADRLAGNTGQSTLQFVTREKSKKIRKRTDGKPLAFPGTASVSLSHYGTTTLLTNALTEMSCDIEKISEKPFSHWEKLLQNGRYELAREIATACNEDISSAATRVWCALECLRKAGFSERAPLFPLKSEDSSIVFESGSQKILTVKWTLKDIGPAVIAVLLNGRHEKEI